MYGCVSATVCAIVLPEFIRVDAGHQSGLSVHGVGQVFIGQSQAETISRASRM